MRGLDAGTGTAEADAAPASAGGGKRPAAPEKARPRAPGPEAGLPSAPPPPPAPEPEPAAPERSAETEAGKGEPVCGYGVEVVELLEMEPLDGTLPVRRERPYHRWAAAAFLAVFVLGVLNAAAVLIYYSPLDSPDDLAGGTCEVAGEVRDVSGSPIPNATVVVTDSTLSAFSNSDGWYVLKGVPGGAHRIEAAAPGYGTMSVKVVLRPNLLRNVDFTLERGGRDVRVDESGTADFGQAGLSYLWAVPLMLVLSGMALAAALLSLRRKMSRTVLALGAAGALSLGFGLGTALAVAGVALAALQMRPRGGPPLKRLRVGISYPQKAPASPGPAATAAGARGVLAEPYSVGVDEQEAAQSLEPGPAELPAPAADGRRRPAARAPAAGEAAPAVALSDIEEVEVYLKERALRAKMASAEIEPSATLGRGEVDREGAPRPRRFVRRSKKGRVLCFVCVNEISVGHEYLRCSCGKTMHVKCLREPRCPDCGCSFRKGG
jgi:hypothetical protein